MKWLLLILSLPTENAAARMRVWRALKACGAAVLRDGVYVLPLSSGHEASLNGIADDLRQSEGSAHLLSTASDDRHFPALFDRSTEFGSLLGDISEAGKRLLAEQAPEAVKQARKLRKSFDQLAAIDFFPGEAQRQTQQALEEFERRALQLLSPDEPRPAMRSIALLDRKDYSGDSGPPAPAPGLTAWPAPGLSAASSIQKRASCG